MKAFDCPTEEKQGGRGGLEEGEGEGETRRKLWWKFDSGGRVAGSDVSLGRGGILFEFDNFIPGGRRLVIDERSEFDRWIRLGTILFFFLKGERRLFCVRREE